MIGGKKTYLSALKEHLLNSQEKILFYLSENVACPSTWPKNFFFLHQKHDAFLWYEYRTLFWPAPGRSKAQILKFLKTQAEVLSLCFWAQLCGGVLVTQLLSENVRFVRKISFLTRNDSEALWRKKAFISFQWNEEHPYNLILLRLQSLEDYNYAFLTAVAVSSYHCPRSC